MIETDLNACRLSTMTELAEMRQKRLCLITKAEGIQRQLKAGLNVMEEALATGAGPQTPAKGQTPEEKDWPTYADLVAVHREMRETCDRIRVLNDRMRQWGVID